MLYFTRRKKNYFFLDNFTGDNLEGYIGSIEEKWSNYNGGERSMLDEGDGDEGDFSDRVVIVEGPMTAPDEVAQQKCAEKDYVKIVLNNPTDQPINPRLFGNVLQDSSTFEVKTSYPILPGGNWAAVVGDYVYITYPGTNSIGILNVLSSDIVYISGLPPSPKWATYANGKIFVTNGSASNDITVIDANPQSATFNTIITTITTVPAAITGLGEGILAGNNIYFSAAHAVDNNVVAVDTIGLAYVATIVTSGSYVGVTICPTPIPGDTIIAVHTWNATDVDFIETDPTAIGYNTVVQSVATIGSVNMGVGVVSGNKLFITDRGSTSMQVIDIDSFTALPPILIGYITSTLNTQGELIFAATSSNVVAVINASSGSLYSIITFQASAVTSIIYSGVTVMYVTDTFNEVLYVINISYQQGTALTVISTIPINSGMAYNADQNPVNFPIVGTTFYVLGMGGTVKYIVSPVVGQQTASQFNMLNFNNAKPCFIRYMCNTQAQMNNVLTFIYRDVLGNTSRYEITPSALVSPVQFSNKVDIIELPKDLILQGDQSIDHIINPGETVIMFVYLKQMLDSSKKLDIKDDYLTWEQVEAMDDTEFNEVDIIPCGDECAGMDEEEEEDYIEEGENLRHEYN